MQHSILRLNLHSLSVSELLEYGRTFIFLSCAYIYFFLWDKMYVSTTEDRERS
jgi:hypothetical protein